MASGGIIGECPICEQHIWEDDEWVIDGNLIRHDECSNQMRKVMDEIQQLTLDQQERILEFLSLLIANEHGD